MNCEVTCAVEKITPQVALEMLKANLANRPIRKHRVNLYAVDIAEGTFVLSGESIIVDWDGNLLNGQHRLLGCIKADTPFESVVVRGVDPAAFDHIDTGMGRTGGDILRKMGVLRYNSVAAAIRLVLGYESGSMSNTQEMLISTRRSILEHEISVHRSVYDHFAQHHAASQRIGMNLTVVIAFGVLTSRRASIDDVERFLGPLFNGVGLEHGDPRLALRTWLVNARDTSNPIVLSAIIRTWNAYVDGQSLKHVKAWFRGTAYPAITERH